MDAFNFVFCSCCDYIDRWRYRTSPMMQAAAVAEVCELRTAACGKSGSVEGFKFLFKLNKIK